MPLPLRPTRRKANLIERLKFLVTGNFYAIENLDDQLQFPGYDPSQDNTTRLIRSYRGHWFGPPYFVRTNPVILRLNGRYVSSYSPGDMLMAGLGRSLLIFEGQPFPFTYTNLTLNLNLTGDDGGPAIELGGVIQFEARVFDPQRLVSRMGTDNQKQLTVGLVEYKLRPSITQAIRSLCMQPEKRVLRNHGQSLGEYLRNNLLLEGWGLQLSPGPLYSELKVKRQDLLICETAYHYLVEEEFKSSYDLIEQTLYGNASKLVEKALAIWATREPAASETDTIDPTKPISFTDYQKFKALHTCGLAGDLFFEYVRAYLPAEDLVFLEPNRQVRVTT